MPNRALTVLLILLTAFIQGGCQTHLGQMRLEQPAEPPEDASAQADGRHAGKPEDGPPAGGGQRPSDAGAPMPTGPLDLDTLEQLARTNNPTIEQAWSQVDGERAKALQAGLYPNPRLGYTGEQIGVRGTAGEFHGGFVRQEFVTAGKLRLSRDKYLARASAAEQQAVAQEHIVRNAVRIQFYRVLAAQDVRRMQRELLETAADRLATVREMLNVGQADRAALHEAEALFREQELMVKLAENDLELEWERLQAAVGVPLPTRTLTGSLEAERARLQWDAALKRLMAESPELVLARAILKSDEITVRRERAEPIPNLVLQGSAGQNYEAGETVYGVSAWIEVPLFDRNQGTVQQAQADLRRQRAELRLVELRLRRALAEQFRQYRTSWQHVETYREMILPELQARYTARLKSYQEDRETWPSVLESQQDYFLRRLQYVRHLLGWRTAQVAIDGLLLLDGLTSPAGVTIPGHIDAVPKPR